jgi:hypothetical protein
MAQAEEQGRICDLPLDPSAAVHTAWDLGVRDATAIWFFQMMAGGIHVIDYYEASGVGLDHYAEVVRNKNYNVETCFVPSDAEVKEWGSGRTRIEQMQALQLVPRVVARHALMDGIGAARETLARTKFDRERCRDGIEALKQYRTEFDETRKVMKPSPLHDWSSHAADAFRYLSMAWKDPEKKDSKRTEELMDRLRKRVV